MYKKEFLRYLKEYVDTVEQLNRISLPVLPGFKKDNPDKKVVIVLYSGGIESTYLLMQELDKGNYVIPVYNNLNANVNSDASMLQVYVLNKNIQMLKSKFVHLDSLILNASSQVHHFENFSYYRQYYNISSIFTLGRKILSHVDEVVVGFDKDDEITQNLLKETKQLFRLSLKFIPRIENKPITTQLKTPLLKFSKKEIKAKLYDLMKKYKAAPHILSCQYPKIVYSEESKKLKVELKPCGYCPSCERNKREKVEPRPISLMISRREF